MKQLRPYQTDIINRVRQAYLQGSKFWEMSMTF